MSDREALIARLEEFADRYAEDFANVKWAREMNGGKVMEHESEALAIRIFPEMEPIIETLREAAAALRGPETHLEPAIGTQAKHQ